MSKLDKEIKDYLAIRRAVGYRLERDGSWLPKFASFLKDRKSEFITTELALEWATMAGGSAQRLSMVRGLAKYVQANDPRTQIPPLDLLPRWRSHGTPYIYSIAEIQGLLTACRGLKGFLRAYTYETLIGLLAITGMRIGEALALNRSDINEPERIISIRSGKFGKSRDLPLHSTTVAALHAYAERRDLFFAYSESPSFFLSERGTRLFSQNVWTDFNHLRQVTKVGRAGLPTPRIHDLRHTFAVRTLLRWYHAGLDVERQLTLLSTYLGHVAPSSTYWYLTGTPELLAVAAKRLEKSLGDIK